MFLCDLTLSFQVNIQVPAPEQQSNKIAITGLASHLDRAKEGLLDRVKELQAEQEDRVSRDFLKFSLIHLHFQPLSLLLMVLEQFLKNELEGQHHHKTSAEKRLVINFNYVRWTQNVKRFVSNLLKF